MQVIVRCRGFLCLLIITVFLISTAGCSGGSKSIAVTITQGTSVSIDNGQTENLAVTLTNDAKNAGVTWALSGAGSLSSQTASSVTYTAPASGAATTVTVTATSVSDSTKSASISIKVSPQPTIATSPLPSAATNGTAYSFAIPVSGGTAPLVWSISAGALPTGLSLNAGVISGTPNADAGASPYSFTVKVVDATQASATYAYSLVVNNPPAPSISTASLPDGTVGTAYSQTIQASGGLSPFTWTSSGTVPPGLTVNVGGVTGNLVTITGTPSSAETDSFTVQVTDSLGQTGTKTFVVTISNPPAPTISTKSLPDGTIGTAYSQRIQAADGLAPFTWTSSGTVPPGLTVNTSGATGNSITITGTPTSAGTNSFTVQVSDPLGRSISQMYTMAINSQSTACTPQGSESLLNGKYVFSLAGYNNTGFGAIVGSFTADGTGKITDGELDMNGSVGLHKQVSISTTGSSYSLGSDSGNGNRGCLIISTPSGNFTAHITVGAVTSNVATKGRVAEWETGSNAFIASGELLRQTTPDFSTTLNGSYVFAVSGEDYNGSPMVGSTSCVGVLNAGGNAFSGGEEDCNDVGTMINASGLGGSYTAADSNGRITAQLTSAGSDSSNIVFYMASSSKLVLLQVDPQASHDVVSGEATLRNGAPAGTWFDGTSTFAMSGSSGGSGSMVALGIEHGSSGTASINMYAAVGDHGTTTVENSTATCAYVVEPNGRTALSSCGDAPIVYLTGPNTGYLVSTNDAVVTGFVLPQMTGSIGTSTISGTFFMGTYQLPAQAAEAGIAWLTMSNGTLAGVSDLTSTTSQNVGGTMSGNYSIDSNGWVTASGSSTPSLLVIDDSKLLMFVADTNDAYPTLLVIEK